MGPVHAWRTLGQLRAKEAVGSLLTLFDKTDDDDEWVFEDLPHVFAKIGSTAIQALREYLADSSKLVRSRTQIAYSLELLGLEYPEARDECVEVLTRQLTKYAENESSINAFIIGNLIHLRAIESVDVMRQAYEGECVDYTIRGDMEEVEISLGLRTERSTPVDYPTFQDQYPYFKEMREYLLRKEQKKIGRNDPCPCGSGKKYKKCCLNKQNSPIIREFLSMTSKRQIVYSDAEEKQKLIRMLREGKVIPAFKKIQEKTGADERFVKEYITRLREEIRIANDRDR